MNVCLHDLCKLGCHCEMPAGMADLQCDTPTTTYLYIPMPDICIPLLLLSCLPPHFHLQTFGRRLPP